MSVLDAYRQSAPIKAQPGDRLFHAYQNEPPRAGDVAFCGYTRRADADPSRFVASSDPDACVVCVDLYWTARR